LGRLVERREVSQLNTRATLELVGDGRNGEVTVMPISVARARRKMKSQQWAQGHFSLFINR
jgi:hypothetical protein